MAKQIEVTEVIVSGTDKKGNAVFRANGTIDGRDFEAVTIQYGGEPIFKVLEGGFNLILAESGFGRGDRIAIARACKASRLEKFGEGHKEKVEAELATGEMVELVADLDLSHESWEQIGEGIVAEIQEGTA
jgi:hypothetical protein